MARAPLMVCLTVLTLLGSPFQFCRGDDDDPVVYKKPLSEWLTALKTDKADKRRRAALLALGDVGLRSRKVVPVVSAALHQDESPMIREASAQLLGRLAYKATDLLPEAGGQVRVTLLEERKQAMAALMDAVRGDKVAKVRTV